MGGFKMGKWKDDKWGGTENGRTFEIVAATNAFEDFQARSRVYADGDVHTAVRQVAKATFGDVSQLGLEKLLVTSLEEGKAQRARLGGVT